MEHAYLQFFSVPAKGAGKGKEKSCRVNGVDQLAFSFNPKEYTVQKQANWTSHPSKSAKSTTMPEYGGADGSSLTLEMFFDDTDAEVHFDIEDAVATLFACLVPHESGPLPPLVRFNWGQYNKHLRLCCVKSVNAKYTLFDTTGKPLRAVCQVALQEIPTTPENQNPTSGSRTATRSHLVIAGDSLASVAQEEYGSPRLWRAVAESNGIDDPLRLRAGERLLLPAREEL